MNLAPEDAIEKMAGKYVKHDKDQFPHARAPHVRNHHVRQKGGVPIITISQDEQQTLQNK